MSAVLMPYHLDQEAFPLTIECDARFEHAIACYKLFPDRRWIDSTCQRCFGQAISNS